MKTVWKFPLTGVESIITMPAKAKIVSAAIKDKTMVLWAEVDTEAPLDDRTFVVKGTGHRLNDLEFYVATIQDPPFVWHIYEVGHP